MFYNVLLAKNNFRNPKTGHFLAFSPSLHCHIYSHLLFFPVLDVITRPVTRWYSNWCSTYHQVGYWDLQWSKWNIISYCTVWDSKLIQRDQHPTDGCLL